ncbi:protein FAM19A5 [Platysternon megacephalum]|uniref:Protein FAM19A5 n=1 Tax=Platysternon megacephalum TaxID=55544 RepID=A0A4D9F1V6_9SAUR|nr:protein FAM19A5 [Platysternon megacephalum]
MTALCAQESIYNLLPRVEEKPIKLPSFSCFSHLRYLRMLTLKNYLLLYTSYKDVHMLNSTGKRDEGRKRLLTIPSVPHLTDHPLMGIQSKKNFINTNAADVIMGVAKKPQPICVDTRQGNKYLLETSGLVPKYINKKDYGLTPKYVIKRNEEGLKKNWEEVHHEFQGLSVEIDTLPKKINKERLESQMKQLEHDINIIEKHKIIYIANKKFDKIHLENPKNVALYQYVQEVPMIEAAVHMNQLICTVSDVKRGSPLRVVKKILNAVLVVGFLNDCVLHTWAAAGLTWSGGLQGERLAIPTAVPSF